MFCFLRYVSRLCSTKEVFNKHHYTSRKKHYHYSDQSPLYHLLCLLYLFITTCGRNKSKSCIKKHHYNYNSHYGPDVVENSVQELDYLLGVSQYRIRSLRKEESKRTKDCPQRQNDRYFFHFFIIYFSPDLSLFCFLNDKGKSFLGQESLLTAYKKTFNKLYHSRGKQGHYNTDDSVLHHVVRFCDFVGVSGCSYVHKAGDKKG